METEQLLFQRLYEENEVINRVRSEVFCEKCPVLFFMAFLNVVTGVLLSLNTISLIWTLDVIYSITNKLFQIIKHMLLFSMKKRCTFVCAICNVHYCVLNTSNQSSRSDSITRIKKCKKSLTYGYSLEQKNIGTHLVIKVCYCF